MKIKLIGLFSALLLTAVNTYAETSERKIQPEAQSERLVQHENVFSERNCFSGQFENYETYVDFMYNKGKKNGKSYEQTKAKLDKLIGAEKFAIYKNSLDCRFIAYKVNGVPVRGYIIKPKNIQNLPVLVHNRGGNGSFGSPVFTSLLLRKFYLAAQGFVIVGSAYREFDEFGGEDVKDVTALIDLIPYIQGVDAKRIGMYGTSRGGMQTHLVLKERPNIKAIATWAGSTDLARGLTIRPEMENVFRKRIPNYEQNKTVELEKRSVIKWAEKLPKNVPILLLHGDNDDRVNVTHSTLFAEKLKELNHPHKLVVYPGGNHGLAPHRAEAEKELVAWFKKYI